MAQDMVNPVDLVGFRGGPFPQSVVDAAVGAIRSECGWHIAPVQEEEVRLRTGGVQTLLMPSLRIVEVLEAESLVSPYDPVIPVGAIEILDHGALHLEGGWPARVRIKYRHGYPSCPDELKAIVAELALAGAKGRVRQESLAGRSVSLEGGAEPMTEGVLKRYTITGDL